MLLLSPLPCGAWNRDWYGAIHVVANLRTQVAAASGVKAEGRCDTTAIRLSVKADPAVEVFSRMVSTYGRWL